MTLKKSIDSNDNSLELYSIQFNRYLLNKLNIKIDDNCNLLNCYKKITKSSSEVKEIIRYVKQNRDKFNACMNIKFTDEVGKRPISFISDWLYEMGLKLKELSGHLTQSNSDDGEYIIDVEWYNRMLRPIFLTRKEERETFLNPS